MRIFLAALTTLALVGCAGGNNDDPTPAPQPSSSAVTTTSTSTTPAVDSYLKEGQRLAKAAAKRSGELVRVTMQPSDKNAIHSVYVYSKTHNESVGLYVYGSSLEAFYYAKNGGLVTDMTTLIKVDGVTSKSLNWANDEAAADIRRADSLKRFDRLMDENFGPTWDAA